MCPCRRSRQQRLSFATGECLGQRSCSSARGVSPCGDTIAASALQLHHNSRDAADPQHNISQQGGTMQMTAQQLLQLLAVAHVVG
jgi:hypothetical protein